MEEIRITPTEDGRWNWEGYADGAVVEAADSPLGDRASCIAEARAAGGAETVTVTRGDGSTETHTTPPTVRVVLLRLDGSEVGELDPPPGSGIGQIITLTPVGSSEEAVDLG